jgi:aspartokinase
MKKIGINGLKLSSELVLLHLEICMDFEQSLADVCRLLDHHNINILFMSTTMPSDHSYGMFCIDADKEADAKQLLVQESRFNATINIHSGVGLLTLFPHQSNLKLVGLALEYFGNNDIPIYGIGSSIGAITFVTDFNRLDDAAKALNQCLAIPPSATPIRSILKVKPVKK